MKRFMMPKSLQNSSVSPKRTARFQSVKLISNYQLMRHPKVSESVKLTFLDKLFDKQNLQQNVIDDKVQKVEQKENNCKLWNTFMSKVGEIGERVQKQKVRIWELEMDRIIRENEKKQRLIEQSLKKVQKYIEQKYKVIHEYFDEIKLAKLQKKNTNVKKQKDLYYKQRVSLINSHILEVKKEIEQQQKLLIKTQTEIKEVQQEKINFLKRLLKQGYYRSQGIKWILKRLNQVNYQIQYTDLPDILDDISKQYVLNELKRIQFKQQKQIEFTQNLKLPSINAKGRSVSTLVPISSQRCQTKVIYQQTKQIVENKIKSKNWEESVEYHFFQKPQQTMAQWRINQKKRIKYAYSVEIGEKVLKILFGTKLEKRID